MRFSDCASAFILRYCYLLTTVESCSSPYPPMRSINRSNSDFQRDLFKKHLWDFDLALTTRLFGDPHQAMSLQNPDILLDVLEIAIDHFRQLIQRAGMARSNRAHKSQPFSRQEVAGSLNTRETDLVARFLWNA